MNRLFRPGETSDEIADIQSRLRGLGFAVADGAGFFGTSTQAAVRAFQQQRSMLVDGIVGPQTWSHLVEAQWRLGDRTLYLTRPFMRGDDVATLQRRMNALGFDAGREDGIFGPLGFEAVRAFQREYGIAEDGMFGTRTYRALEGLRVDRPGTAADIREELRHRRPRAVEGLLVMLDPGHGGEDLGMVGPNGLAERDVCWALTMSLAQRLAGAGVRVRLSRTEPENPDPSERSRRANDANAEIIVSLHLNSTEEPTAEGASAYHFGTSKAGEALAEAIQSNLVAQGARDCRIHARSYPVLRETRMPAVLVEPAFITNPEEAKRLEDPQHLGSLAAGIAAGILDFFTPS